MKEECKTCHGTGAKREPARKPVRSAAARVRLYLRSSLSLEQSVTFRRARTAAVPVRLSKKNVLPAVEQDILLPERRFRFLFRPVLTMDRVSVSVIKENLEPMVVREVICS